MNEHIDILLTTSKLVSQNNSWAHLATHSISMGYIFSMVGYYSYQLEMIYAMNRDTSYGSNWALSYAAAEQVQHAIHSFQENRQ